MTDFMVGSMLFVVHLITVSLAFGILSSIFVRNARNGYIFLTVILLSGAYTLSVVFDFSVALGYSILFMYLCLGILTYFNIKRKKAHQVEGE
ncbi:hypothetical protein DHX103_06165 [Planococcus sp. X10-3]|uniref:hypothetical protein n=1 Tax=Planococcus sp. X10-3 TaxID=3061240 RepID=UPI003BB0BB5E